MGIEPFIDKIEPWRSMSLIFLGVFVFILVLAESVRAKRVRYRLQWSAPSRLVEPDVCWRHLEQVSLISGLILLVLVLSHFIRPVSCSWGGLRMGALSVFAAGLCGSVGLFWSLGRVWSVRNALVAVGLLTGSVCSLSMVVVSGSEVVSPLMSYSQMTGLLFSLAILTGFWSWITGVWHQQLDNGKPWTTAGRMYFLNSLFALCIGLVGVAIALRLAFGPRLLEISETPSSRGLVISGLLGHLLLLVALARCFRQWKRIWFGLLSILVLASGVVFVITRTGSAVSGG